MYRNKIQYLYKRQFNDPKAYLVKNIILAIRDEDAKNMLIEQNYPLVKSVIRRYRNKGVDYDDLFQLGCVGFVKAINNFDTNFKVKFSTYAVPIIMGEIKRYFRDDGTIKVSRSLKELNIATNQITNLLRKKILMIFLTN